MADKCVGTHWLGASANLSPHHRCPVSYSIPYYISKSHSSYLSFRTASHSQTLIIKDTLEIFSLKELYFSYLQFAHEPTQDKMSIVQTLYMVIVSHHTLRIREYAHRHTPSLPVFNMWLEKIIILALLDFCLFSSDSSISFDKILLRLLSTISQGFFYLGPTINFFFREVSYFPGSL